MPFQITGREKQTLTLICLLLGIALALYLILG